jgi:integrase
VEGHGQPRPPQSDEDGDRRHAPVPATRLRIKATLRALNDAIDQQILIFNPAAHVELDPVRKPKALVWTDARVARSEQTVEKPTRVMVWTPEQTGAFLDFLAEDRLYAMWHLIAFRCLRREACAQPWSETNLDDHSLTVSAQLVQDGWEGETSEPKTDSGFRVVTLDDATVNVLKRYREQQDANSRTRTARSGDQPGSRPAWSSPRKTAPGSTPGR